MKEEAILKAAKKLFSKFGFKKVSMDEIAREAGVTKKTVYANFSSKEELLNELIKYELKSMKDEFESIENKSDDFFEGIEQGLISLLVFRKKNNLFKVLLKKQKFLEINLLLIVLNLLKKMLLSILVKNLVKLKKMDI